MDAAIGILQPVIESSIIIASHYCKACGRTAVTGKDVCYGMMFAARNVTGKQIGTLFPEIYDEDGDDEEIEEVDEEDEPWSRYEGDDELMIRVNNCADTWDAWQPESPVEESLKRAVTASLQSLK